MPDTFANLIPEARAFLSDLNENNTREWFMAHKTDYDNQLKAPAMLLMDQICADLTRDTGRPVTAKLFRPHRDVRFSKDKTPYHVHLHMAWNIGTAGAFLGIAPDYVRYGAGIMGFDKSSLGRWRDAVAGTEGETVLSILADLQRAGFSSAEPELKRVPAPFPKDHPRESLLRRKSLTLWADLPSQQWNNISTAIPAGFRTLNPLCTLLDELC